MECYKIFERNEKRVFFDSFGKDIIHLVQKYNIFFIIGSLNASELVQIVSTFYEKAFHLLNTNPQVGVVIEDRNYFHFSSNISEEDLELFYFLNLKDVELKEELGLNQSRQDLVVVNTTTMLRKILQDPLLMEYNVIFLTEVDQRYIETDLLLCLLKKILSKRKDLLLFLFADSFPESILNFFNNSLINISSLLKKEIEKSSSVSPVANSFCLKNEQLDPLGNNATCSKKDETSILFNRRKTRWDKINEEEKLEKEEKVKNCLFVKSPTHSFMFFDENDSKQEREIKSINEKDITKRTEELETEELIILKEWEKVNEELQKVHVEMNIFIFHLLSVHGESIVKNMDHNSKHEKQKYIYYLEEPNENYLLCSIQITKQLFERKKNKEESILVFLNNDLEIEIVENGLVDRKINKKYIEIMREGVTHSQTDLCNMKNRIILFKDKGKSYKQFEFVKYIIDTCREKDELFDYDLNFRKICVIQSSKQKCEERTSIAKDASIYRVITKEDYVQIIENEGIPEILKKNIFYFIFYLKTIGIKNLCSFEYITPPSLKSLKKCLEYLYILKLIDTNGNIMNRKLSLLLCSLPLPFKYSVFLLNGMKFACLYEICAIISIMMNDPIYNDTPNNMKRVQLFRSPLVVQEGDILSYFNIFQKFQKARDKKAFCYNHLLRYDSLKRALQLFKKLEQILHYFGISLEREFEKEQSIEDRIGKALVASFFYSVCKIVHDKIYKLLNQNKEEENNRVVLHPLSVIHEAEERERKFVVCTDMYMNEKPPIYMKHISVINPSWLPEIYPTYFINRHIIKQKESYL